RGGWPKRRLSPRSSALDGSLFQFGAGLVSYVRGSECHANFLEEIIWRRAAGENPHDVVGDLLRLPIHLQHRALRLEFDWRRIEQDFDFPRAHVFFDPLGVAVFDAAE